MGVGENQEFLCPWGQLIFLLFLDLQLYFPDLFLSRPQSNQLPA
jgi:hypothetical protein